jgi:sialate O-acetylesterase
MKQSKLILIVLFLITLSINAGATDFQKEFSLQGNWSFKIGDNPEWSKINFDDSNWKKIYVPSPWEDEGYQGYDGYAWYRRVIEIPSSFKDRTLTLELGYIDDVDEVFYNGVKIGQTGSFPPYYSTAYNARRLYDIPLNIVNYDKPNTIAVRVYDSQLEGGIVRGDVRIGASDIAIVPDINLNGTWNFNTGMDVNETKMQSIIVPGRWENQGFYNYDGYAVYSRVFNVPENLTNIRSVFLAGRIDDYDQLYINGKLVGQTGDYGKREWSDKSNEYRNYFIPAGVLKPGENKVEIKVHDGQGEGGIMEGTVGIISQDNFIKYWRMKRIR